MKNVFKLFGLMLLAGSIALVSCDKDDDGSNNNNNNNEPAVTTYTVTVNCNDDAMGTVTKTPDSAAYHAGTEVTITATPNDGYKFIGWTGAETIAENTYTFTVSANATYTANFEASPSASWSATFDGSALDIAGWGSGSYLAQSTSDLWLIQFAKQAEGTQVWFPYIVMWMGSTDQSDFQVLTSSSNPIELYKDTHYTASDGSHFGDWQYYATNSLNCTAMDMTTLMLSFTGSFSMYWLTDIVNENAETPDEATKKDLNITVSNLICEDAGSKAPLRKMNIKK